MQQVLLWRQVPGASEEKPMTQAQGSKTGILNGMMAEWGLQGYAGARQVKRGVGHSMQREAVD